MQPIKTSERLPKDDNDILFHEIDTKVWHHGYFNPRLKSFMLYHKIDYLKLAEIDYWMPVPTLPEDEE